MKVGRKKRFLIVEIEGRGDFKIPMPESLTMPEAMEFNKAQRAGGDEVDEFVYRFFKKHIGDVTDTLTVAELMDIARAWGNEGEITTGESSA